MSCQTPTSQLAQIILSLLWISQWLWQNKISQWLWQCKISQWLWLYKISLWMWHYKISHWLWQFKISQWLGQYKISQWLWQYKMAQNWIMMISELRRYQGVSYKSDITVISGMNVFTIVWYHSCIRYQYQSNILTSLLYQVLTLLHFFTSWSYQESILFTLTKDEP